MTPSPPHEPHRVFRSGDVTVVITINAPDDAHPLDLATAADAAIRSLQRICDWAAQRLPLE
jgi:hypothetical protein